MHRVALIPACRKAKRFCPQPAEFSTPIFYVYVLYILYTYSNNNMTGGYNYTTVMIMIMLLNQMLLPTISPYQESVIFMPRNPLVSAIRFIPLTLLFCTVVTVTPRLAMSCTFTATGGTGKRRQENHTLCVQGTSQGREEDGVKPIFVSDTSMQTSSVLHILTACTALDAAEEGGHAGRMKRS